MRKSEFVAKFYARVYGKCPYCERPFRKPKHSMNSKRIKKWLELF